MSDALDRVPDDLADRRQWILSEDKQPMLVDGTSTGWNDFDHWVTLEEARTAAQKYGCGIGFVFTDSGPYVGIDIDNCLHDDGNPREWLPGLDDFTDKTYIERSTSGNGLHVIVRDVDLPEWWINQKYKQLDGIEAGVEAYTDGQYFVFTGDAIEHSADTVADVDPTAFLLEGYEALNGELPRLPGDRDDSPGGADLDVYDVLSRSTCPEGTNTEHPFHGSDTGTNFMVDDDGETWRCWRHDVTGNALHLVGIEHGVIECGDWKRNGLDTDTWRDIFNAARDAGYDVPDPKPTTNDGGTAVAQPATAPSPTASTSGTITQGDIVGDAGKDSIADLNDREKAYTVYGRVRSHTGYKFVATRADGAVYTYDDGVWLPKGDAELRQIAHNALGAAYGTRTLKELVEQVRALDQITREKLGAPAGSLPVANGLLDLEDKTLRSIQPDDYVLNKLPVEYDETATCPTWRAFLEESVHSDDLKKLQEYTGYTLHHWGQPFKRALLLIGPTDSGKSTYLKTVRGLLGGHENVASESLTDLIQSRWGPAKLYGKMANVRNEITPGEVNNPQRFKELIGGEDMISAEFKGQDKFEFVVTQKFMFATNRVPDIKHRDEAFNNRWLFADFPHSWPKSEQDPRLLEKFEAELPGILNWALEGYERLLEQSGFTDERMISEKEKMWEKHGGPIDRFKHNCLRVTGDDEDFEPKDDVYLAYKEFCREENVENATQKTFTEALVGDPRIGQAQRRHQGARPRCYVGVRLIDPDGDPSGLNDY